MTHLHHTPRSRGAAIWLAAALMAMGGLAQAASPKAGHADQLRMRYEHEKADCMSGHTGEPRNVCLREAAAAYAQARHGRLAPPSDGGPAQWARNALLRCQSQHGEDRELCERRVREGQVSGSVEGGGQMTTLTVRSTDIPKSPGG
ncbi:hypothetical protein [Roseateles sp.]|uniref:hypothetical protein n=1 Tax=Roseateles sp. TaxID=1971397 RepID=UPI0025FEC284|nr:hypothetical protein [Roseateles sp.]MBV8035087.1 hypothetical protein [Roseateles sp.]